MTVDPLPRQFIPYEIPLGRDAAGRRESVRLVLPQDMTDVEAERICQVIRTLGFPAPAEEAS